MAKERLDVLVTQRGLAESCEKAQRMILAGEVRIKDQIASKPGLTYPDDAVITIAEKQRFASRGGEKLEGAFDTFPLDVSGLTCIDIGASTGGFTDCLLQHGAAKIYAVDVGRGLIAMKLRNDPRVVMMEKTNARHLEQASFEDPIGFICIDVSFISLTKILPAVTQILEPGGTIVSLIKPQFEAGRKQVGKGGVVKDPDVHRNVVQKIKDFGTTELGLEWIDVIESPLKGPAGNIEFLAHWKKSA